MIKRVFATTGNFWIGSIRKELRSLINRRRSICQGYEEDIFNDVVIELLEAGTSFPDLPEDQVLTRIIDRVCQRWNRQLRIQHSREVRLDDEFIEVLSFKEWKNLIAESEEDFCPLEKLNNLPVINSKYNCNFSSTIYIGTDSECLIGPIEKKNSENVKNKKTTAASFRPSKRGGKHDITTLDGLRDFITEEFCGYRLSPIRRSYSPGCELSFQFENFCPICHKRGQCLSVVQKTNGSLFYQCFHPDADDLLCGLGVQRKSIPKLMAIVAEGAKHL